VGEHRHQMRRGRAGAARPAQRLAVQRHRQQPALGGRLSSRHGGEVRAEATVQLGGIQSGHTERKVFSLGRRNRIPNWASTSTGAVAAQVQNPA
jgi:hypothetical protein